jgi:hypothetical protein
MFDYAMPESVTPRYLAELPDRDQNFKGAVSRYFRALTRVRPKALEAAGSFGNFLANYLPSHPVIDLIFALFDRVCRLQFSQLH